MSEEELIRGIKARDNDAFREIVYRYQKNILNTCLAIVHDPHDADDLAQEVFIELLQSVSRFRGDSRLSTWLYRVAVNKSLNHISKIKRKDFLKKITDVFSGENQHPPVYQENLTEQKERRKIIHAAIDKLPRNQKIAFSLNKYDELSYKEISEIMNISVSSVESLLVRAKQNLRKSLEKYYTYSF